MRRAQVVGLRLVLRKRGGVDLRKHEELERGLCAVKGLLFLQLRKVGHGLWAQHSLRECPAGRHTLIARAGLALVSVIACVLCRRFLACNAETTVASPALEAAKMPSRNRLFARSTTEYDAVAAVFGALLQPRHVLRIVLVAVCTRRWGHSTCAAQPASVL